MPDSLPPDINDDTIPDDEVLYRRIPPRQPRLVKVEGSSDPPQYRPASGALKETEWPLSVDLGSLSTPEQTRDRDTSSHFHVAAFKAAIARSVGCRIVRDPLKETPERPANPAHALIFGNHKNGSGALDYKSQGKPIARAARIVLINANVPLIVEGEDYPSVT